MIQLNDLRKNSSTLEELTNLETDAVRGGFLPLLVGVGAGAAGGAIGQGLGNLATGKPIQTNVLESAALGGATGLLGPVGAVTKAIPVARPLLEGAKSVIPASGVLGPIGQGAAAGLGNSLISK
jgi:hypothetical protein